MHATASLKEIMEDIHRHVLIWISLTPKRAKTFFRLGSSKSGYRLISLITEKKIILREFEFNFKFYAAK